MNARLSGQLFPQLREVCPQFDEAARAYDAAVKRGDLNADTHFREMQRVADIFRCGFEHCETRNSQKAAAR
jgi:hypothetical protein